MTRYQGQKTMFSRNFGYYFRTCIVIQWAFAAQQRGRRKVKGLFRQEDCSRPSKGCACWHGSAAVPCPDSQDRQVMRTSSHFNPDRPPLKMAFRKFLPARFYSMVKRERRHGGRLLWFESAAYIPSWRWQVLLDLTGLVERRVNDNIYGQLSC